MVIISLGLGCGVAMALKKRELRLQSLPLDWHYVSTLMNVNDMISTAFKGIFSHSAWKKSPMQEDMTDNETRYHNTQYDGLFSVHDFMKDKNFRQNIRAYCEKQGRRVDRFYKFCKESERILFVRDEQHFNLTLKYGDITKYVQELRRFCDIMDGLRHGKPYKIVVATEYTNKDALCAHTLPPQVEVVYCHSNDQEADWKRLVVGWDYIFDIYNRKW